MAPPAAVRSIKNVKMSWVWISSAGHFGDAEHAVAVVP